MAKLDWMTFTAAEWSGMTASQFDTFTVVHLYDPTTYAVVASYLLTPTSVQHVEQSVVDQMVMDSRVTQTLFISVEEQHLIDHLGTL